jgi:hypothetical protein
VALDPETRTRIYEAYNHSIEAGHWKGAYASKSQDEWFAELTKHYFTADSDALAFYDPNLGRGRQWLRRQDPKGFALVDDLFSGRLEPGTPRWDRVSIRPASDAATLRSPRSHAATLLRVTNRTAAPIRVVWIDFDGDWDKRKPIDRHRTVEPGATAHSSIRAGHAFVITDVAGRALCTVVSGESDSAVVIDDSCDAPRPDGSAAAP